MKGKLISINISECRGTDKKPVEKATLLEHWGIEGDAHAGDWHRQVSLLSYEKIEEFNRRGAAVAPGAFGENLIITGFDLRALPVGTRFRIGATLLEMTQIGKECHSHCQIFHRVGDCIMPREGVFAVVIKGGEIHIGDEVSLIPANIYSTIKTMKRDSDAVLATVVNGENSGESLLIIDGIVRSDCLCAPFLTEHRSKLEAVRESCLLEIDNRKVYCARIGAAQRLIICGGGHVANALIRIAKSIGFEVWVIEDREFFAQRSLEAGANKVICDSYEMGLSKVPAGNDNYFVCATRGHRFDMNCLHSILNQPNAYIGLMASRNRAASVRKDLIEAGFDEAAVSAICSPIGLDIAAETPQEIAISIAGELIQCRNGRLKKHSIDKDILEFLSNSEEKAALCTIIEKHGSAPRSVGTQMLVSADGSIFGTVGGGGAEAEVIRICRSMLKEAVKGCRIVHAEMTPDEAAEEGMVCGGTIDVFIGLT